MSSVIFPTRPQIVDLPGIIHNGDGKDATTSLINSYIKSPQTLILLVSEAKQDNELISALALATKHDPDGGRTLRVLTKFDTFDSDDARTAAARLVTSKHAEPLGPHAVVCRAQGDASYDEEVEKAEFKISAKGDAGKLPEDRMGVTTLKERLPNVFTTLIRTNLNGLKLAALERIKQCSEELRKLGENPLGDVAMIRECQRVLTASRSRLQTVITPAFFKFQEAVHATEANITADLIHSYMEQDAFQCPFFQGETVFARCMREIVKWWREPAKRFLREVQRALASSMVPIEEDAIGVSKVLRGAIDEHWTTESDAIVQRLSAAFKETLDESVPFGTANHYLYSKYIEQQVMPDDVVEAVIAALTAGRIVKEIAQPINNGHHDKYPFQTTIHAVRAALVNMRDKAAAEDRHKALHEHVAKRVLHAVKAAWSVEKKTVSTHSPYITPCAC